MTRDYEVGDRVIINVTGCNPYKITKNGFIGEVIRVTSGGVYISPVWTREEVLDFVQKNNPEAYSELYNDGGWFHRALQHGWQIEKQHVSLCETEPEEKVKLSDFLLL